MKNNLYDEGRSSISKHSKQTRGLILQSLKQYKQASKIIHGYHSILSINNMWTTKKRYLDIINIKLCTVAKKCKNNSFYSL